ncbi:hypothetical protein [Flindersiella endophytica]
MSRLLASTELLVTADHRMFGLCDDGPDGPFSAPTPGSDWLGVGTYEVVVGTAQDGVQVKLRLEAWDGQPATTTSSCPRQAVPRPRRRTQRCSTGSI